MGLGNYCGKKKKIKENDFFYVIIKKYEKKNQIQLGFVCLMKDLRKKILEKNDK